MLKTLFLFTFIFSLQMSDSSKVEDYLKPCPNSPNCVSTIEGRKRKQMPPLSFDKDIQQAKTQLKQLLATYPNTTLVNEDAQYLHYTFVTKLGKFTDDVEFFFDGAAQKIHYRSASRKGYSDMGANRRRMKKIAKIWAVAE